MITKVIFMAFDKQCEMWFSEKTNEEIHATLHEMCSSYVVLSMETLPEDKIQAEDLPF